MLWLSRAGPISSQHQFLRSQSIGNRHFSFERLLSRSLAFPILRSRKQKAVLSNAASVRIDREDRTAEASTSSPARVGSSFHNYGLDERVLGNLQRLRLLVPTDVQEAAIPELLGGCNAAIQSYTGSGKTLAYLLPVLSKVIGWAEDEYRSAAHQNRAHKRDSLQAVIVAPSRELAMQILRVGQSLLPDTAKSCLQQAIGGANMSRQIDAIQRNQPLVVVGTPGRIAELSRAGKLLSHSCKILVLDEVDQLLAPQFREDLVRIEQQTGKGLTEPRQTIIVSATLSDKVLAQCQGFCASPSLVRTGAEQRLQPGQSSDTRMTPSWGWSTLDAASASGSSAGGVGTQNLIPAMPPQLEHAWLEVNDRHRVDTVRRVIHALNARHALIFMNFQSRLKDTEAKLKARGMPVASLSGGMSKEQRQNTLASFRKGQYRALIVSDLMARGLDIEDCDAVINLELPSDASHYAHRAGRTGRAGRPGCVVSIAQAKEAHVISKLAKRLDIQIDNLEVHSGAFRHPEQKQNPQA